jgi:hypothetical protein
MAGFSVHSGQSDRSATGNFAISILPRQQFRLRGKTGPCVASRAWITNREPIERSSSGIVSVGMPIDSSVGQAHSLVAHKQYRRPVLRKMQHHSHRLADDSGFDPVVHARARPICRTSRRKSGANTSTVRHISYSRDRIRAPMRSASESSRTTTRCPPGILAGGSAFGTSSR